MDIEYDDLQPGISPDEDQRGIGRVVQIVAGVLLVAAGIVMLIIPGPGLVAIMVGLNMIKPDNPAVRWMRRKVPGVPEDGEVPRRFLVIGAVFLIGSTTLGILYGAQATAWARDLIGLG